MGVVELLTLAIAAASTVAQVVQSRKAAKSRRESQAVATAGENIRDKVARRRSAREERIRRARLIQASENAGTEGSSGEVGAISALGSNFAGAQARQSGQTLVAKGISAANQKEADAISRGNTFKALGSLAQEGLGIWDDWRKG